jgi:hypothetical protein
VQPVPSGGDSAGDGQRSSQNLTGSPLK